MQSPNSFLLVQGSSSSLCEVLQAFSVPAGRSLVKLSESVSMPLSVDSPFRFHDCF